MTTGRTNRRDFLGRGLGLAASSVGIPLLGQAASAVPGSGGIPYRTLGRSGEKVSMVGLGGYHIGTQADATVGLAAAYRRHHTVTADASDERHAKLLQLFADEGGGCLLVQRELGMRVEMTAPDRKGVA